MNLIERIAKWIYTPVIFFFGTIVVYSQNAPIVEIESLISYNEVIEVDVTVNDFQDIGSFNLQINYDATILQATSVTKNAQLSGFFSAGVATPGQILISWFTYPYLNLPDGTVLFTLNFSRVNVGKCELVWYDDGFSCAWSNSNFQYLNDQPTSEYYKNGSIYALSYNAPITSCPPPIYNLPGEEVVVPVSVADFNNIGFVDLFLEYDPSVISYIGFENTSGFPNLNVQNSIPGSLVITGEIQAGDSGVFLENHAIFFQLNFITNIAGSTTLTWYDNGESCQYLNSSSTNLADEPYQDYYFNGEINVVELEYTSWSGNEDADWFNPGNWIGDVPSIYGVAYIPQLENKPYPVISGNAVCHELNIEEGSELAIAVDGTLTNKGPFINNGQLIIKSDNTGDGSFIQNKDMTGSGDVTVERYITSEMWHYISPPVANVMSGLFNMIYLKEFIEEDSAWQYIVPTDVELIPMRGYAVWASNSYTGNTTVAYTGELYNGELTIALTNHGNTVHNSKGFNFVGNPFPSALNWESEDGWTRDNIDNAIYLWNPQVGQYGSYLLNNPLSSTNDVDSIIPSGQGFFVHVTTGNATGSLSVNNLARVHDTKPFFKAKTAVSGQYLKLKVTSSSNNYSDETIIQFKDGATESFDPALDAYKLPGINEVPQLFTLSIDNNKLSVNSLPLFEDYKVLPLVVKVGVSGIYTLEVVDFINFDPNSKIIIEDKLENVFIDIKDAEYNFLAHINDQPDRFLLHFEINPSITEESKIHSNILIFARNSNLILKNENNNDLEGLLILNDLLGREILIQKIKSNESYRIKLNLKGNFIATYIDNTNNQTIKKKVFLY